MIEIRSPKECSRIHVMLKYRAFKCRLEEYDSHRDLRYSANVYFQILRWVLYQATTNNNEEKLGRLFGGPSTTSYFATTRIVAGCHLTFNCDWVNRCHIITFLDITNYNYWTDLEYRIVLDTAFDYRLTDSRLRSKLFEEEDTFKGSYYYAPIAFEVYEGNNGGVVVSHMSLSRERAHLRPFHHCSDSERYTSFCCWYYGG